MPIIKWKEKINKIKSMNDHRFVLAISGGVDSMVLLDFFNRTFSKDIFVVANYNHKVREESDYEQEYIGEYCKKNNIQYFAGVNSSKNYTEECLRNNRWKFLENTARKINFNTIVTGHHLDDQIENFIFRMMRGSDLDSLYMDELSIQNNLYRFKPFLNEYKESIKEYATKKYEPIKYFEDVTNQSNDYDRNRIRNELIPDMMTYFNVKKTIPNLIEKIKDR